MMKFSGWDALEIQGKAKEDIIIYIDGNKGIVEIYEVPIGPVNSHILAEEVTEFCRIRGRKKKHICDRAGEAAEHTLFSIELSFYDRRKKVQSLNKREAHRNSIQK